MSNNEPAIDNASRRTEPNTSSFRPSVLRQHLSSQLSSSGVESDEPEKLTMYEFIDSREMARRLTVPASWIRDQVRARSEDPLPHVNLGKYVRFLWGSPGLEEWIRRRIVKGNNRRVGRVP